MSLENAKRALEKYLNLMSPSIQTAYEAVNFNPTNGVPYQYVQLNPWKPQNPTLGDQYFRDTGEFQIFLCYPTGKGTGEVLARAELVRLHFKRGTTLTEGVSKILVPAVFTYSIISCLFMSPLESVNPENTIFPVLLFPQVRERLVAPLLTEYQQVCLFISI